jgi:hypothetical protein
MSLEEAKAQVCCPYWSRAENQQAWPA